MRNLTMVPEVLLAGALSAGAQLNQVIESFDVRATYRFNDIPDFKSNFIGFRCVWEVL